MVILFQLIAGRHHFRLEATVIRRSGTGPAGRQAGRVPSLPFRAIHLFRQPAIPDEGRSQRICAPLMTRIFNEFRQGANPHSLGVGNIAQSIRQKTEGTIDSQRSDAVGRFDVHHVWFRYDDYRCISFLTTCLHKIRTA